MGPRIGSGSLRFNEKSRTREQRSCHWRGARTTSTPLGGGGAGTETEQTNRFSLLLAIVVKSCILSSLIFGGTCKVEPGSATLSPRQALRPMDISPACSDTKSTLIIRRANTLSTYAFGLVAAGSCSSAIRRIDVVTSQLNDEMTHSAAGR